MDQEIDQALEESLDSVFDVVAADGLLSAVDRLDAGDDIVLLDIEERAIEIAAHVSVATLSDDLRAVALRGLAVREPMYVRVSRPGDGSSVPLTSVTKNLSPSGLRGIKGLYNYSYASAAAAAGVEVAIGIDGEAVANDASPSRREAIAAKIKEYMCGELKSWLEGHWETIKKQLDRGVGAFLKWARSQIRDISSAVILALTGIGMGKWAAYLMIGLIVILIVAAIRWVVSRGLHEFCEGLVSG